MTKQIIRRSLTFALVLGNLAFGAAANAENWPTWRGPGRDGISSETTVPTKWSKTEGVLWRVEMPGPSGATPAVWGDRIFVTSADKKDLLLLAFDTSGKQLWSETVGTGNKPVRGDEGNFASPSPSTDGKHVWTFMGNGLLACYTVEGKKVWGLDVQDRYGKLKIAFGMSSTPILDKGRLYLQLIHGEGREATHEAAVVALDAATGKEIWKVERLTGAHSENEHSYASPALYRDDDREFLVTHGGDYVIAHSLKDGSEIWRCGLNPKGRYHPTLRFVASPLAVPGMIVVPSAKKGPYVSIRPDVKGDITGTKSAFHWKKARNTPDVPSPLAHDGLVYLCLENGNLVCHDGKTGEIIYTKRTTRDRHRASPVYAAGHIYTCGRKGVVTVTKAGKKFEIVSQNDMKEPLAASPAISGGRIYLRTFDALYAIGPK
jgi:outer membrane protein assembly factor BamB